MNVDGIIYANDELLKALEGEESLAQVQNVACLPGIVMGSLAMPDIHWGYGFPIGGVAAFDIESGVVSPGGVGYDISCGIRLIRTNITKQEAQKNMQSLVSLLFQEIPTGVGSHHKNLKLSSKELDAVLCKGAAWAVKKGYGDSSDLENMEDEGTFKGADPVAISERARERGCPQLGTLGSGNHFMEVGFVDHIYDEGIASAFGLVKDCVTIFIHTGSRGLGHQVCDDNLSALQQAAAKYKIALPDRQLACAPIKSPEGQRYLKAMAAAANFAYANRQMITHYIRAVFERVFKKSWVNLGLGLVYDVSHNIAKFEEHEVDGKKRRLLVHRKGATRAFPAGHKDIPQKYQGVGQPVLIPGDMGRYSYVLVGTQKAMEETFGSTCHGAGRLMSRHAAKKVARGRNIERELREKGIIVVGATKGTIDEECSEAYKDVATVVDCVVSAGISKKVAGLKPLGVVKG